jgi:hypothetical protein
MITRYKEQYFHIRNKVETWSMTNTYKIHKMNDVFVNTMTIDGGPIMRRFPLIVEEHDLVV